MYRLRTAKLALQRQLLIRGPSLLLEPQFHHGSELLFFLRRSGARKRRFFSSHEELEPQPQQQEVRRGSSEDRNLESYTKYVLRSQRLPLGTMTPLEWDDVVAAIDLWTTQNDNCKGYDIDSAEQLLQRLLFEMTVTSTALPGYHARATVVVELRRVILHSWLRLHQQHPSSIMALDRSEKVLLHILKNDLSDDDRSLFPVSELLVLCDGFLQIRSAEGIRRAAKLLLTCTKDPYHLSLTEFSTELSLRFDQTILGFLSLVDRRMARSVTSRLCDRMDFLKQEALWPGMELSEATQRALQAASLEDLSDELSSDVGEVATAPIETTKTTTLSSFEAEAMEKRMIEVLRSAEKKDEQEVAKILKRMKSIEKPSEGLLFHLVDFYLRGGDIQNATIWIQLLSPAVILSKNQSDDGGTALIDRFLDAWSLERHPRAPWRAEEMFREILDRAGEEATVSVQTVNRFLQIWSQSSDPAANRKVREWFNRMTDTMNLKPDSTSLSLVLKAMDQNSSASESLLARIVDEWNDWEQSKKQEIAETLIDVLWKSTGNLAPMALTILNAIQNDNLTTRRDRYLLLLHRMLLKLEPKELLETIERLQNDSEKINLDLYEAAMYSLIKRDEKTLHYAEALGRNALDKIESGYQSLDRDSIASFLNAIMKMCANLRYYSTGESFLNVAEAKLLPLSSWDGDSGTSLIPLQTYKNITVRNWYRPETSNNIVELFRRIQSLYEQGYSNLRPDQEVYLAYLKATAMLPHNVDDLENILNEMKDSYNESSGESSQPQAEAINVLLLSVHDLMKDPKEAAAKSLELWKRFLSWNVTPNTKTINLVMNSVTYQKIPQSTYLTVLDLYNKFEEFKLEPDPRSFHLLISACSTAGPLQRKDALQRCLKAFGEIRKIGAVSVFTYASLTKSLRRLLLSGSEGPVMTDKVASSTFKLCCQDGLLAPEVREAFRSLISTEVWTTIYSDYLSPDNEEPKEWHRRLPKPNGN